MGAFPVRPLPHSMRARNRGLPTAFQTGILDSATAETIMNRRELELAALAAADRGLKARGYIALDEVFREMGKLEAKDWEDWRRGRVPYLERIIRLNLNQINAVCRAVHASARRGNLKPSWTAYVRWGKGPRPPLRFTKSGDPQLERAWATRYICIAPKPSATRTPGTAVVDTPAHVVGGVGADLRAVPSPPAESGALPAIP
jgi:hypothetical protein